MSSLAFQQWCTASIMMNVTGEEEATSAAAAAVTISAGVDLSGWMGG